MYWLAKALAIRAALRGSPAEAGDVEHVRVRRRFDADHAEQFVDAERAAELRAHGLGDFGRLGDRDLRVGFALRFARARGADAEGVFR